MTCEYAEYFKLLLLSGYKDELEQYVEHALAEEEPISDIVLELSSALSDDKKMLSALNKYLLPVKDSDIDYDHAVFGLVMSFLKKRYVEDGMSMKDVTALMYQIALNTRRYLDEPWQTMYWMGDMWEEVEAGYFNKAEYQRKFDAFLSGRSDAFRNDPICFSAPVPDTPPQGPKGSLLKRIVKKLRGER